jgi:UDP-N-acetylmuramoyl-L-alanyl-D-glutamate--2,6-diaminopimelate ligase
MEVVSESPIKVIVDYAHTPDQLEAVYKTFKDDKMICVLGSCGGGRDKWKRPVLGEIAKKYCKEIIITNEDPYDEDPMEIINQVAETAGTNAKKILDRKEAIKTAVGLAKPGDVVIITGKGSEPWMCLENGKKIPWDDRQIAREAIKK